MDDLLADFLTETTEGLQSLDGALLSLERNPGDASVLGEVFRTIHTIKGTCGFLGLPRLERVAHAGENVLGCWREGSLPVTPGGISLILTAVDRIKAIVAGLETAGTEPVGDDGDIIAPLDAAFRGEAVDTATAPAAMVAATPPPAPDRVEPPKPMPVAAGAALAGAVLGRRWLRRPVPEIDVFDAQPQPAPRDGTERP